MDVLEEMVTLDKNFADHDFFVHIKPAYTVGKDGGFPRKVKVIKEADAHLSDILKLKPIYSCFPQEPQLAFGDLYLHFK